MKMARAEGDEIDIDIKSRLGAANKLQGDIMGKYNVRCFCCVTMWAILAMGWPGAPLARPAQAATREAGAPRRFWPLVHRGETFLPPAHIKAVQYLLRAQGNAPAVDGVYGAQAERMAKRFQRAHHLKETGRIAGADWEALIRHLHRGDRGDAVRALQTLLREAGRGNGEDAGNDGKLMVAIDGNFGAQTERALRYFQKQNNLVVDGIAGAYTWCQLSGFIGHSDLGYGFTPSPGGRG